jgi:predicted aspartyl protease
MMRKGLRPIHRILNVCALLAILLSMTPATQAEIYKWIDENGEMHVATSLADVPAKYRDQVTKLKPSTAPAPKSIRAESGSSADEAAEAVIDNSGLQRFEIPYKNEGSTRRVIIPVKFNERLTVPMALDTGSPGMVISIDLAIDLGLFRRDSGALLTTTGGIGGAAAAISTIVDSLSIAGVKDDFIPTTVIAPISPDFDGLIGMDILANYTMSIDSKNKVVVFQENPPDPDARGGHDETWWRDTFQRFRELRDAWRQIEKRARESGLRSMDLVEYQARQSERLLQRLEFYASDHSVPRHWR